MAVPTDIAGLVAWYKADSITGTSDGATFTTWTDSSGNGYVTNQPISTHAPVYKASILNSLPVLRFDATTACALRSSAVTGNPQQTIFVVLKPTAVTAQQTIRNPDSAQLLLRLNSAGKVELVRAGTAIVGTGTGVLSTSAFSVVAATYADATSWATYINGAADASGTHTQTLSTGGALNGLGADGIFGGNPFGGDIAEIFWFSSVLSTANRDAMTSYLGTKYGLAVSISGPPPDAPTATTARGGAESVSGGLLYDTAAWALTSGGTDTAIVSTPDVPAATNAQGGSESVVAGVTKTDSPGSIGSAGGAETALSGTAPADTSTALTASGGADTTAIGVLAVDVAGPASTWGGTEPTNVGVVPPDTSTAAAVSGGNEFATAGVQVADQPTSARAYGGSDLAVADVLLLDVPAAAGSRGGTEVASSGVSLPDVPGHAVSATVGAAALAGVALSDQPGSAGTAGGLETVGGGVALADTPGAVQPSGPQDSLTVDVRAGDTAEAATAGAPGTLVVVDVIRFDDAGCVAAASVPSTWTRAVLLSDFPAAILAAATWEALSFHESVPGHLTASTPPRTVSSSASTPSLTASSASPSALQAVHT